MDQSLGFSSQDHDIIIEVRTDLKNLNTNLTHYMSTNSDAINDHEHRIRVLETEAEVNKGSKDTKTTTRRNLLEIIGIIAAVVSAYATYLLGHSH